MPLTRTHGLFIGFAATVMLTPAVALAQDEQPEPKPQTIVAFEGAPLSKALTDPKDAGLRRALLMLPARLRELPEEIPDLAQAPAGIFDLIDLAFEGPYRLVVVSLGADPQTGMPRISGELAIGSSARAGAEAAQLAFAGLVADAPQFQLGSDGDLLLQTPGGAVSIGAYEGAGGRWWFGARLGDQGAVADAVAALPAAPEGRPLMRGSIDLRSLIMPLKMMGAMMAGGNPEAAAGMAMVENLGILDAMSLPVDSVAWSDDSGMHSRTVVHGARETLLKMGFTAKGLTGAQLGAIPADAVAVSISKSDPDKLVGVLEMIKSIGPEPQQALDSFTETTGVDLENDIIRSLDGVYAAYSSDSTGGSGLMSWVGLAGVRDHDAMGGAMEKLMNVANGMARGIPYGDSNGKYLRIARTSQGGINFLTFQTPGIPVPFSPTIALTDRWLIVGASRQSALAAAMQAAGKGDRGLVTNTSFMHQRPASLEGVVKIQFIDTPRAIVKGYGITTLLGGMLENVVRSPLGADREPGMVVPPYNDLVNGSRAIIKVTKWEGDDLIMLAHTDGSALVNIAGVAGVIGEPMMLVGLPAIVLPGIAQARQNAIELIEEEHGERAPDF